MRLPSARHTVAFNMQHRLSPHESRAVAVAAMVDPRSVNKCLAGGTVTPLTLARITKALRELGRTDLLAQLDTSNHPPQAA